MGFLVWTGGGRVGEPVMRKTSFLRVGGTLALAVAGLMLVRCGAPNDSRPADVTPDRIRCAARNLDVLVFNIEYGGTLVDFGNVVEAIRRTGADVVAIEEAYGNIDRLARELAWPHYDRRTQVLSRLPLVAMQGNHGASLTLVEVSPGCVVSVGNVHLPSAPSGGRVRGQGGSRDEVVALEKKHRMPPLEPVLQDLGELVATGVPSFLAGDFNASSHRDEDFPWPTSLAVEAAGFRDSYREIHPDQQAHPGFTWWAGRPQVAGWNPSPDAPQSRIDFLYAAGPARVTESRLVGEQGGRDVDIAVEPWVSDHRAIVSSFEVEPARIPVLIAVPHQRTTAGEDVTVQYHSRGSGSSILLVRAREMAEEAQLERAAPSSNAINTIRIPTRGMTPGAWEALLVDGGGVVQARAPFWVTTRGAQPGVETSKPRYRTGGAITARWSDTPGNRWDWVGVYDAAADPSQGNPLLWRHTNSAIAGEMILDETAEGGGWPLPPGDYRLVLSLDDSYVVLAEARFEVVP